LIHQLSEHLSRWLVVLVCLAFALGCSRFDQPPSIAQAPSPLRTSNESKPTASQAFNPRTSAGSWGLVPYWNNLPPNPIHQPRAVYLDVYWRDFKPNAETVLTPASVLAVIEKRLGRSLAAGPPVSIRFKATGDAKEGPLPEWFTAGWKAPKKCNTEKDQQLPAWTDPEQVRAHAELVKALASALDGHPQVSWVEPGSYGFWGEGHLDGAPPECGSSIETREALVRPWVDSFRQTPLSITMDWIRSKDDPKHRLRTVWSGAASIGLRFDCLGFWHDEYAAVIESMLSDGLTGWTGPWGGEFCYSEQGAQWAMGSEKVADIKKLQANAPRAVSKMTGEARRNRVLAIVRDCGWSYVAGAGGSLLAQPGEAAQALESAMNGSLRDLQKCVQAARVGTP
jgi:hypothetical protein